MIENKWVKILRDFQIQTDKLLIANQPDTVVVDKHQRTAVVVDVAILRDGNIRKKEHEKLEKEGEVRQNVGFEGSSGTNCDWGTGSCNPQAGLMVPAHTRKNI